MPFKTRPDKLFSMKPIVFAAGLTLLALSAMADPTVKPRYNVLFIISDDMRAELGCYGGKAVTPNIDRLAATGVRFDRAYCQYPLCNPSRSSMLTSRIPTHTGVFGNRTWFGDEHPDFVSLPRWFKEHGYITARSGKIFHDGIDDTEAWNEGGMVRWLAGTNASPKPIKKTRAARPADTSGPNNPDTDQQTSRSDRWVIIPGNGETDHDYRVANKTIEQLEKYQHTNFFLACGFAKPHSPPSAPQDCYDLYSLDKIELPVNFAPRPTVPEGFPKQSIRPKNADLFIGRDATTNQAKEFIRAYLASCSYVDQNVGRVLAALDRLHLRTNTIVVFWGDHGYQLGERGKWSKAGSLFEQGDRVPFLICYPPATGNGQACERVVESLDFYPTLVELCGLPKPKDLEGRSLMPLLQNPKTEWNHVGYTIWSENGKTLRGVAVRDERWRYAEFEDGGAMLFDQKADPQELKNVVDAPENQQVRARLSKLVRAYIADFKPATNAAPAAVN